MAKPSSYATATIIMLADLARNLFANNQWLNASRNWSASAKAKDVVWNQSGAKPGVVINRVNTALTPAGRTDVKRTFSLDEYQTIPTSLDWTDEYVINYDKRNDILSDHRMQLENDIALRILYNWAKAGGVLRTTSSTGKVAASASATGNRKVILLDDFINARTYLKKQDIPDDGRAIAVVPADMEGDLLKIKELQTRDSYPDLTIPSGALGRIAGFNIFVRSSTVLFNNASTPVAQLPKADDTVSYRAGAATDNMSITCYHPDFVTRAISPDSLVSIIDVHGGTEMSATVIAGGDSFRVGGEGIVNIVEAVAQ